MFNPFAPWCFHQFFGASPNREARRPEELTHEELQSFRRKLTEGIPWPKYDPFLEQYVSRTPMNSYDVLKCSQACFHLFDYLRLLLPEQAVVDERPEEEEVEVGEWKYIVLDPKGVTLRSHPTYDKAAKLKDRLEEGEIVEILERRAGAETVFLRVETTEGTRGWAFTTQPGPGSFLRLLEVEVKSCNLYFQVLKRSHLRRRCSFAEAAKVGRTVEKGQLLHVIRRLEVGGTTCLQIDSGEWLVCPKDWILRCLLQQLSCILF
eukprot:g5343.t1